MEHAFWGSSSGTKIMVICPCPGSPQRLLRSLVPGQTVREYILIVYGRLPLPLLSSKDLLKQGPGHASL